MPTIIGEEGPKNKKYKKGLIYNYIECISNYRTQRFAITQGYKVSPSQQQLFYNNGKCQQLVITNHFGEVKWEGNIDISRLAAPLSQTVNIKYREIEVYIGDKGKPVRGKELNRPCLATFKSAQALNISNLVQICNKNGTKMMQANSEGKTFTIAIPHFTRYNFNQTPQTKKQTKQRKRLADTMLLGRRNRGMEKRNTIQQISNKFPLTSKRLEQQYETQTEAISPENNIGSIMDGLKNYVVDLSSKLVEKEVPLHNLDVSKNSKVQAIQNENRNEYHFSPYAHTIFHTAVLQNVLFSADGEICQLKNYQKYQKIVFLEREKPVRPIQHGFQSYLLLGQELIAENIAKVVCEQKYTLPVRRLFSLYAVLFAEELCFIFKSNSFIPQLSQKYVVSKQIKKKLIKDWLSWVIRQQFQSQLTSQPMKNKVMSALALRKPELAINYLIVNNRWTQAMLISRLQDSKFRQLSPQKFSEIHEQFQIIFSNQISKLPFQQWLICFGFCAWYFVGDTTKCFSQIVNSQKIKNNKNIKYGLELRLFQLYIVSQKYKVEYDLYQPIKPSREQLCALWFISNCFSLQNLQRQYWTDVDKLGEIISVNYAYQLNKRITQLWDQNDERIPLLLATKLDQIDSLLGKANKKIKTKSQFILLVQQLISEGKMIEALRLCLENDNSEEVEEKIYFLVCHPSILLNYRTSIREEVIQLLLKKHKQFEELILLLTFQNSPQTGVNELNKILRLYRGDSRFSKMLTSQIRSMIKSKLQMCIGNWIYQHNKTFQLIKQNLPLITQLRLLLQDSDLFQDFDSS